MAGPRMRGVRRMPLRRDAHRAHRIDQPVRRRRQQKRRTARRRSVGSKARRRQQAGARRLPRSRAHCGGMSAQAAISAAAVSRRLQVSAWMIASLRGASVHAAATRTSAGHAVGRKRSVTRANGRMLVLMSTSRSISSGCRAPTRSRPCRRATSRSAGTAAQFPCLRPRTHDCASSRATSRRRLRIRSAPFPGRSMSVTRPRTRSPCREVALRTRPSGAPRA